MAKTCTERATMRQWCSLASVSLVLICCLLPGAANGAVSEGAVSWHKVGEGLWERLGVTRDQQTAYVFHESTASMPGQQETKATYRVLAVDLKRLKLTNITPSKVLQTKRYAVIKLKGRAFLVRQEQYARLISPDQTKVALPSYQEDADDPEPSEDIFLLDLKTLTGKVINAQDTVQGYSKAALYAKAGPQAFLPPTWASPVGWLSRHEIVYRSERTGDGLSLWVLDIRDRSERLLVKLRTLEEKWGKPMFLVALLRGPRLLLPGPRDPNDIPQFYVTDLAGNLLDRIPGAESDVISPNRNMIIVTETSTSKGQKVLLPPTAYHLDTGRKIPLPPLLQSLGGHGSYHWREDGGAFATYLYPSKDLSQIVLAVVELDETRGTATLQTVPTDLTKGLFDDFRWEQALTITWLDRAHLLLTTVKARPYVEVPQRALTTWILRLH